MIHSFMITCSMRLRAATHDGLVQCHSYGQRMHAVYIIIGL